MRFWRVCVHDICAHVFTYMCRTYIRIHTCLCSVHREQKRASDPLELTFLFLGFPQSSKGSRNGSPSNRETSNGHLTPAVPARMEDGHQMLTHWTRKIIVEEGHTVPQLVHILHLIVQHFKVCKGTADVCGAASDTGFEPYSHHRNTDVVLAPVSAGVLPGAAPLGTAHGQCHAEAGFHSQCHH